MRKYNDKISKKANECLRKREIVVRRQRGFVAFIIMLLVAFGVLLGSSINTLASSDKDIASYKKYYKSIRIECGDTLWTIADQYVDGLHLSKSDYIAEVCEINNISENEIHTGNYIIVPYYSNVIQ